MKIKEILAEKTNPMATMLFRHGYAFMPKKSSPLVLWFTNGKNNDQVMEIDLFNNTWQEVTYKDSIGQTDHKGVGPMSLVQFLKFKEEE